MSLSIHQSLFLVTRTLLVSLKTVRNALVIALRVADDPTVQRVSGTMQSLYQTVVAHPVVAGSASRMPLEEREKERSQ